MTPSVSQAVRDVLNSKRFYYEVLESGVANFTALAEKIKPDVERSIRADVNTNTIVAALKRFQDSLSRNGLRDDIKKDAFDVKMTLTDNLIDLVIGEDQLENMSEIYEKLSIGTDIPFSLFHTEKNYRLYTDSFELFNRLVPEDKISLSQAGKKFTKVTLDLSRNHDERVFNELISEISNILIRNHIDIHSAFFTPSEIVLVAEGNNAVKLFSLLHEEILRRE